MSVQASINDAARRWLRSIGEDVDEVLSVQQQTQQRGMCETCRHEETIVAIIYEDHEGGTETYTYRGDFGAFIRALDETTP